MRGHGNARGTNPVVASVVAATATDAHGAELRARLPQRMRMTSPTIWALSVHRLARTFFVAVKLTLVTKAGLAGKWKQQANINPVVCLRCYAIIPSHGVLETAQFSL